MSDFPAAWGLSACWQRMRELVQQAFFSTEHDHFSQGRHFLGLRDNWSALRLAAFVVGARLSGVGLSDDVIRGGAAIDMAARAVALQERLSDGLECPPGENRAILVLGADWNLAASAALCGALPAPTRDVTAGQCLQLFELRFRGAATIRGERAGPVITEAEHLTVARDATGVVFRAMASIAALPGGTGDPAHHALGLVGENLGIAVHILDDIQAAAALARAGSRVRVPPVTRFASLPVIRLAAALPAAAWPAAPGQEWTAQTCHQIAALMAEHQVLDQCRAQARQYLDLAAGAAAPLMPALGPDRRDDVARLLSSVDRHEPVEVGN